jgi:hypothetical protein
MIPTSVHAELRSAGTRIGKVTSIQLQTARDALETTTLDIWDRTFISGLRNSSASGTLFYDPEDETTVSLLNALYADGTALSDVELLFDGVIGKGASASAVITNASLSVAFGEAAVCEIQFQLSGKPDTSF